MAQRKIVWTNTAENSLKEITEYYLETTNSNKYGNTLVEKINKAILNIRKFNFLGKITEFSHIRALFINQYEIFYRLTHDTINIELIWDSRRNPEDLKKLL